MTISSATNQNTYSGNGSTTVFAYGYKITDDDHLEVVIADADDTQTTLTKTTHYTVSGVDEDSGGNVTTEDLTSICSETNLPTGWTISIRRIVPLTQLTDLENQGGFFAETHEDKFDYLTMMTQQQQNELDRCPKVTETSGSTGSDYLDDIQDAVDNAEAAQTAAEAAQTAAETAETNAETAETNAETAQTNAETAQTAAETAQTAAEAAAASGMYANVQDKSGNYTVVEADEGDLIRVDTSGGAVTITLPLISGLTDDFRVAIAKWTSDGSEITIQRSGSDTINGGTSVAIANQYNSYTVIADTATDTWLALSSSPSLGDVTVDRFSGDGIEVDFTLSTDPGTENNTRVFVAGVYQQKDTYSVAGTTLTFSVAPPSGTDNIEIFYASIVQYGSISTSAITGQAELTAVDNTNDVLIIHDDSASVLKKVSPDSISLSKTRCSVKNASSQSIPTGSSTKVVLDTEDEDTGSEFDTSSYRYTANKDKTVIISYSGFDTAPASGMLVEYKILKNGADLSNNHGRISYTTSSINANFIGKSVPIRLSQNDYIELYVYHDKGSNHSFDNFYLSVYEV